MQGRRYWIENGNLTVAPKAGPSGAADEDLRLQRDGVVRVTTGDIGTEIKWSVFSPCFSSLYAAINWLPTAHAPFVLRYYLSGWFEEVHQEVSDAIRRLEEILAKSEIHIAQRTFVKQVEPSGAKTPSLLLESFLRAKPVEEFAVECIHDAHSNQYRVERVGPKSVMARIYGTVPASYPCKNGNSYDRTVSEAYNDVIVTGRPRYDHVLASLYTPDNTQHWLPYHRVIFPMQRRRGVDGVLVMTEVAEVGIRLI
jgi:hypothetical protein